jgi:hypothetical protein
VTEKPELRMGTFERKASLMVPTKYLCSFTPPSDVIGPALTRRYSFAPWGKAPPSPGLEMLKGIWFQPVLNALADSRSVPDSGPDLFVLDADLRELPFVFMKIANFY